jgi:hypothetical protein
MGISPRTGTHSGGAEISIGAGLEDVLRADAHAI